MDLLLNVYIGRCTSRETLAEKWPLFFCQFLSISAIFCLNWDSPRCLTWHSQKNQSSPGQLLTWGATVCTYTMCDCAGNQYRKKSSANKWLIGNRSSKTSRFPSCRSTDLACAKFPFAKPCHRFFYQVLPSLLHGKLNICTCKQAKARLMEN